MKKFHYFIILILLAAIIVPVLWSTTRSAGTSSTSSLEKGLVGHWDMDQSSLKSSTTIADKSPNRNTGTAASLGNPTLGGATDQHGQANRATTFDGTDDYVRVADSNSLDITTAITITAWINLNSTSVWNEIVTKRDWATANTSYAFRLDTAGKISFYYMVSSTSHVWRQTTSSINASTWYFVSVSFTPGSSISVAVNGSPIVGSWISGDGSANMPVTNLPVMFSGYYDNGTYNGGYFSGFLTDVRIYNRVLSDTEVSQLFASYNPKQSIGSLQKGLVGYWPLDQTSLKSSTTVADETPNRNTGTAASLGNPTLGGATDRHGQASKATEFDGDNDNINLGDLTYLNSVSKFSMSFWMNQDVLDQSDILFNKQSDATHRLFIAPWSNGNMYFEVIDTVSRGRFDYSTVISAGVWAHVVMIYDGTQADNATRLKVYVNSLQQSLTFEGTIPATTGNFSGYSAYLGYSSSAFDGKLADFRIYNRVLSTTEVSSLYNSYRPKISTGSLNKGLVGYWPLDQSSLKSSTTVADKTPNRNTGTLVGSPTFTTDQKGQASKAMSFNGSSQEVSIPSSSSLNPISITLSAWVYPNALTNGAKVITKDSGGGLDRAWQIQLNGTGGQVQFIAAAPITWDVNILSTSNLSLNTWTHITATVNSSSANLYFNGINVGTDASSGNLYTSSTFAVEIGGTSTGSWFLNGKVSDVRIYNRALSAAEVTALYQAY